MNILQIIAMGWGIYRRNAAWYALAGLMLFTTALISAGLVSAGFLIDCGIALVLGRHAVWTAVPAAVITIALVTLVELAAGAFIAFSAWGAFTHLCARIGAGGRQISLLGFFEEMSAMALTYFLIGSIQQAAGLAVALPVFVVGVAIGTVYAPVAAVAALLAGGVWLLMQLPFWLAFPAQVVQRRGAVASVAASIRASIASPLASLVMLLTLALLALVPLVLNVFYPLYLFFVFAPLYTTMKLVYFEAISGMLGK
ncbi:MAG: hypothetical protein V1728_06470 [Candidatus Micrarchaeota archaeon]